MPVFRVLVLSLFILASELLGQLPDSSGAVRASGVYDSTARTATDTMTVSAPSVMEGTGSLTSSGGESSGIPDSSIVYSDFRSPDDLLRASGGVFVIESGEGGFDRLSLVNGMRPGSIAWLADGLLLNDPSTGLFSTGLYPLAFAERLETATPATGSYYALNGVGGAVNFVSRDIRAIRPVSGLRFSQSAFGYSMFDGALTQDVSRGLNVSIGITHPSYDGRYLNSDVDAWGARAKVRYDLDGAAVYISDLFTRRERGLNDGISASTPDSLLFDRIRAEVVNESARELLIRHDLRAGAAIGTVADSSRLTLFDLQFSGITRRYIDEAEGTGSTGTPFRETRREQSTAVRLTHTQRLGNHRVSGGIEVRDRRLLEDPGVGPRRTLQGGAFARLEVKPLDNLTLIPAARVDRTLEINRLSGGIDASLRLSTLLRLRGSLSRSHRFPSFIEAFGIASQIRALPAVEAERHDLISAGLTIGDSSQLMINVDIFHRSITDAITLDSTATPGGEPLAFLTVPEESRKGFSGSVRWRAGSIETEVNVDYLLYGSGFTHRYAPEWSAGGGIYFRDRLIGNHLDLKAGFRGRYFTSYEGGRLSRRFGVYIPSHINITPAGTVDLVIIAGLGDAFIHLIWENLLDRRYFMEVLYPADARSLRIGVTWSFLD